MIQIVQDWRPMWGWVEEGLRQIIAKRAPTWVAADVYAELKSGLATLATVDDGFLILKRLQDYDGPILFVWVVWGPNKLAYLQEQIESDLTAMAKAAGCVRLQMRSPRRGWARVGWQERETVYERDL